MEPLTTIAGERRGSVDEQKTSKVMIFGQEYRIRGWADSNYIEEVAEYVDSKMREVSDGSNITSTTKVAILAALNISDELFTERGQTTRFLDLVESRAEDLSQLLDEVLATEEGDISEASRSAAGGMDSS